MSLYLYFLMRCLFRALPQESYDINDLHRLKFHTGVTRMHLCNLINKLGYNDHFIYFDE